MDLERICTHITITVITLVSIKLFRLFNDLWRKKDECLHNYVTNIWKTQGLKVWDVMFISADKPANTDEVMEWFRTQELPRGVGLDENSKPFDWFHGETHNITQEMSR